MADGPRSDVATGSAPNKLVEKLPDGVRNHFIACAGEFVGTLLFLFYGLAGAQVANTYAEEGSNRLMYISLAFGLSLIVNAFVFFRISGSLFNPAVTVGLVSVGAVAPVRGGLVFITQIAAGIVAALLVEVLIPGPLNVSTSIGGGTNIVQAFFLETILTFQLILTIFMMAGEKHKGTFMAPLVIGLGLFGSLLVGLPYSGASLNPARSFGPQVILMDFRDYDWIYWAGPIAGGFLAASFYKSIKALGYQTAVPDQDADAEPTEGEIRLQEGQV